MAYDEWFGYGSDYLPPRSERWSTRGRSFDAEGRGYGGEYWPRPGGLRPFRAWLRARDARGETDTGHGAGRGRPFSPRWRGYGRDYFEASRAEWSHRRRNLPPDYRYLSREEYGLGPEWERAGDREHARDVGEYFRRDGRGPERFNEGVLGPRNALFGREGFRRYADDYEQWW